MWVSVVGGSVLLLRWPHSPAADVCVLDEKRAFILLAHLLTKKQIYHAGARPCDRPQGRPFRGAVRHGQDPQATESAPTDTTTPCRETGRAGEGGEEGQAQARGAEAAAAKSAAAAATTATPTPMMGRKGERSPPSLSLCVMYSLVGSTCGPSVVIFSLKEGARKKSIHVCC